MQHAGGSDPMGLAGRGFGAPDAVRPQRRKSPGGVWQNPCRRVACGRNRVDGWFANTARFVEGYSAKALRGNMAGTSVTSETPIFQL
jgi:hypothetical protein